MRTRLEYHLRRAIKQVQQIKEGKLQTQPIEDVLREIQERRRSANKVRFNKWKSQFVVKRPRS